MKPLIKIIDELRKLAPLEIEWNDCGGHYIAVVRGVETMASKHSCILGSVCGRGTTEEAAIRDLWEKLTDERRPEQIIVVDAMGDSRRIFQWNATGFIELCADCKRPKP